MSEVERLEREVEELRRRLAESERARRGLASGSLDDDGPFRAIFEGWLDAMLLADDHGNGVDANRSACELFGIARERLLGRNVFELVEPQRLETTLGWEHFLREGRAEGLLRLARGDGDARDLDVRATANIVPGLHLIVLRDVTARRRDDEVRSRLAAIVESSDAAIISTDLDGVITTWNKGAERLYEWRAAEALGKDVSILIPAELESGEQGGPDHAGPRGSVERGQTRRRRKDGSVVEVALRVAPIRDADAKVIGAAIVARDLTERRNEEAARRSAEAQALRGSETILLVEDDARVRTVTREILRRHGYDVLDAPSAGEALLLSEQRAGSIHLLVTDVVMPRMSGPELASRLAGPRPEMRVLYVSGHAEASLGHHGLRAARSFFLLKPITPDGLLHKVRDVLDATPSR